MSETMARCLGVASNSARFKAASLRSTPLICHAWHDIFPRKGGRARAAITVLGVNRCAGARDRMKQIAANNPGPYFVYCCGDQLVLGIENTEKSLGRRPSAKHATAGAP